MWGSDATTRGGFTLLELLVVLTVSGLLFALAGPPLLDIYQRSLARAELAAARETLAEIGLLAYIHNRAARLSLNGREMRLAWVREEEEKEEEGKDTAPPVWRREFARLFFPPRELAFTPLGYPDALEVAVTVAGREERLSLASPALPERQELRSP